MGLASVTVRSPAIRDIRESEHLYNLLEAAPGTDDPSTPTWLDRPNRRRGLFAPLALVPVAVP